MAAFDHSRNMYDVALKPRLLRTLLKEQVPDEKRPLRSPTELNSVVSLIKIHGLLSEKVPELVDEKVSRSWKSTVDDWVDRVLMLAASNNMPDKCWAGVCLLGITCADCSSNRFFTSHSVWFNVLLPYIQISGGSQFVRLAACASLSDLLARLGTFPNLKRDGASHAGKLIQPILKLLDEDGSESIREVAAHLLCIIVTSYPQSIQRQYDNAEATIVSKIRSGNCSANLLKKLACCLALFPKSKGDEHSWSLMMHKIILSASVLLNDALEGLEEESRRDEAVSLLVPPGSDPPPPLGSQMTSGGALNKEGKTSQQLLISTITTLMQCCCTMLTTSYPVQVIVPVRPLLAMVKRVLMVDGSLSLALQPFTTTMQQEYVCSQLPVLHLCSLEILTSIVKGMHSQILPHVADIVWLLVGYFKKCRLPQLRTKVYSIMKLLLTSMGVGIALYISQEVINNAFIDLKPADCESTSVASTATLESSVDAVQPRNKKRKHAAAATVLSEGQPNASKEEARNECSISIALKIAALEALEALLTVGGALISDPRRKSIDSLLITVATNACRKGWARNEDVFLSKGPDANWGNLQLAAFHALSASLLSPPLVRPPFLSQAIELFHRGRQATGTRIAELCGNSLRGLELLIHPRALPVGDFPSSNLNGSEWLDNERIEIAQFDDMKHRSSHTVYDHDFLDDHYLEDDDGFKIPKSKAEENLNVHVKDPLETSKDQELEQCRTVNGSSDARTTNEEETRLNGDDAMKLDAQHVEDPTEKAEGPVSRDVRETSGSEMGIDENRALRSATDLPPSEETANKVGGQNLIITRADNDTVQVSVVEPDNDSSAESWPDIVDADPDSD